jgi:ribosomal-protein-alanine N-acetyltransferase
LDRIAQQPADAIGYFMIEMQGRVVGTAGLHKVDEIWFTLHPDVWRQGVVTDVMTATISHLFNTSTLPQLTADADPLNTASVQCLKSLGFQEAGRAKDTLYIAGQWSDSVYFALPRPQ